MISYTTPSHANDEQPKTTSSVYHVMDERPTLKLKTGKVKNLYIQWFPNWTTHNKSTVCEFCEQIREETRMSIVLAVINFLGNKKFSSVIKLVECMLSNLKDIGCNMSIKIHYPHSHLEQFLENLGNVSKKQG